MTTYIITEKDTGCPHSCIVSSVDAEIAVPDGDNDYQYFIVADSEIAKQIMILRILQELYQRQIHNCMVEMIGIHISKKMKAVLKLLTKENKVIIHK